MSPSSVTVYVNGIAVTLPGGFTVAAAVARITGHFRYAPGGTPRGPFCGMGYCGECRLRVEGEFRLACQTPLSPGLRVETDG
jgi:sarcosine oxidase subunit alpha